MCAYKYFDPLLYPFLVSKTITSFSCNVSYYCEPDNGFTYSPKGIRDKQNDPSLHFNFEFESTVEDIETDNDQFITEYLHWGNTRKLTKDVVTRWNSTYFMLKRIIELEEPVKFVLIQAGRADLSPSDEQWEVAKQLCALLRPFSVVNDILQGEKYPTLGSVSRYISWLLH